MNILEKYQTIFVITKKTFKFYNTIKGKTDEDFQFKEIELFLIEKIPLYEGKPFNFKNVSELVLSTWNNIDSKLPQKIFIFLKSIILIFLEWRGISKLEKEGILEKFHIYMKAKDLKKEILENTTGVLHNIKKGSNILKEKSSVLKKTQNFFELFKKK